MTKKTDYFLEIASTKHPSDTTDKEIPALEILHRELKRTSESAGKFEWTNTPEESIESRRERFEGELAGLREHYLPYMRNLTPLAPGPVQKQELKEFRFRYLEKGERFTERFAAKDEKTGKPEKTAAWESVTIPDYRGPGRENGKWKGYYTCEFADSKDWRHQENSRVILSFQCVDYIAKIYVNGSFVGMHEGFFAPFSLDVTDYLEQENEITILCENDIPILGEGPYLDGDKIYAATGPGWDDPEEGWHHCPAGAGVFGRVTVELRPTVYLKDVFVRYVEESSMAEVRVGIWNYTDEVLMDYDLKLGIRPRNFEEAVEYQCGQHILCVGPGSNEYRYFMKVDAPRLWEPDTPCLYNIDLELQKGETLVDRRQNHFGFKTFICDEESTPKGKFYLNGRPVVLRGANEMGHLQQCVMQGDMEQLIDDILIAKHCNLNYYRVTQRPVQEEIYDYFDMLGMMHQCDLPLFSFLRRPQFAEAVKQTVEMEHLIRSHVSTVMVTFINEPVCIRRTGDPNDKFSRRYDAKGHRHLLRDELEAFFVAARKAVYVENPDRVIKNVEGDYDGPTMEGMPDFHTYTMWYTSHGEPIGRLMRGYLPPVKEGWMTGCGEYGAEGLDNENIMLERYPKEWIQPDENGHWLPDRIVRSQTHSVHGDWYPEQNTMEAWIEASQNHQAEATKLMTDAFRRRGDILNQTAIHLLIDAWPAGWMKTLLGCDRKPKKAYFAYKDALIPLKGNLYAPRRQVYEGDSAAVEVWLMNDTGAEHTVTVQAAWGEPEARNELAAGDKLPDNAQGAPGTVQGGFYEEVFTIPPAASLYAGDIVVQPGFLGMDREIPVSLRLLEDGEEIYREKISLKAAVKPAISSELLHTVVPLGNDAKAYLAQLEHLNPWEEADGKSCVGNGQACEEAGRKLRAGTAEWAAQKISEQRKVLLVTGDNAEDWNELYRHVTAGGRGVLLLEDLEHPGMLGDIPIAVKKCGDRFFVDAAENWKAYDIRMLYHEKCGYIDVTADRYLAQAPAGEEIFFTYDKQGFLGNYGAKRHLPIAVRCPLGEGEILLTTLCFWGRLGCNPDLDKVLLDLLGLPGK